MHTGATSTLAERQRPGARQSTVTFLSGELALRIDDKSQSWTVRFKAPKWWSEAIYEMSSLPRLSTYVFRTYNVVRHHSEIVQTVIQGDHHKVRELFQSKKASPYDVVKNGKSLLQVCLCPTRREMMLTDHGSVCRGAWTRGSLQTSVAKWPWEHSPRTNQLKEAVRDLPITPAQIAS